MWWGEGQGRKIFLQEGMDEPVPATHTLKQDTLRHLFEEWDGVPGEYAAVCEEQSEHILLDIGFSAVDQLEGQPVDQPKQ